MKTKNATTIRFPMEKGGGQGCQQHIHTIENGTNDFKNTMGKPF